MNIFERLRIIKSKEGLAALSTRFSRLPFGTKVIAGVVALGLVLILILALLPGGSPSGEAFTKEQAVAILLDEVIQPQTVDHYLIAFALDEPLPYGSDISPFAPSRLPDDAKTCPTWRPIKRLSAPSGSSGWTIHLSPSLPTPPALSL